MNVICESQKRKTAFVSQCFSPARLFLHQSSYQWRKDYAAFQCCSEISAIAISATHTPQYMKLNCQPDVFQRSPATYLEIKHATFGHKGNRNSNSSSERIPTTTEGIGIPVLLGIDEPCEDKCASVLFTKPSLSHPLSRLHNSLSSHFVTAVLAAYFPRV